MLFALRIFLKASDSFLLCTVWVTGGVAQVLSGESVSQNKCIQKSGLKFDFMNPKLKRVCVCVGIIIHSNLWPFLPHFRIDFRHLGFLGREVGRSQGLGLYRTLRYRKTRLHTRASSGIRAQVPSVRADNLHRVATVI